MSFTVASALKWWARDTPDAVALKVGDESLTFRELFDWSGRVAVKLLELGVRRGDRVSMVATNSLPYAVLAFGVMRAGGVAAPISFRFTAAEIASAVGDLSPRLVFTDADRREVVQAALGQGSRPPLLELDSEVLALRSGAAVSPKCEPAPDDALFVIGTSGSTARPKWVVSTHRSVMSYASEFALMEPRCARGSKVLVLGPFSSSSGYLLLMQFTAMGATLFIERGFAPERALDLITREKLTTFQGAPIFFERIAAMPAFAEADLSSLYWAQVGGAPVKISLLRAWLDKGVVLRQLYGSTEAGGGWAARLDTALDAPEICGRGGLFTRYAISGPEGVGFSPPGDPGEILVRGPCMTTGYWNDFAATSAAIRPDGWLRTGDIGTLDEQGNLRFIDRLKDIIISGGLNISAAEVERVLQEIDGVEEAAVIAAEDPDFGETPLAILHGDTTRMETTQIIEHCNGRLANYKVPRYLVLEADPLPRLASGKIAKTELRERYRGAAGRLARVR